ncbi:hypothetical protein LguiA_008604 [Lonicera macranthoides]
MGTMWNVVLGFKATIVMVVIQIMFAGANVLYKLAANDGLIVRIMVAYRFIFAAAFMVLLALYDERSEASATHSPYNVQPRYKLEIHKKGYGARARRRNLFGSRYALPSALAYYKSASYEPMQDIANRNI